MSREHGVTERQLSELAEFQESDAFSAEERLVIELAVEMTRIPVSVPEQLMNRLHERFSDGQLVELVAAIAWENYRARFNRPFGIEAAGFSKGRLCALPELHG